MIHSANFRPTGSEIVFWAASASGCLPARVSWMTRLIAAKSWTDRLADEVREKGPELGRTSGLKAVRFVLESPCRGPAKGASDAPSDDACNGDCTPGAAVDLLFTD